MKISELAKVTAMSAPTIRYYEKVGLLDGRHVRRGENNYRDYATDAVAHLLVIKEVQAAGFTLAEFKALDEVCSAGEPATEQAVAAIRTKIAEVDGKIAELERTRGYLISRLAEVQQPRASGTGP